MSEKVELRLGSRIVSTVHDLLGVMENDLTYSLGWALASSPHLIEQASQAATATRNLSERRLLREFARYLKGAVRMQDLFSNWTYCVSVSAKTPAGWPMSFRDVVDEGSYFHPYGISGWPKTP